MKRRMFSIVAAVSFLLCAATVALWVRSYWITDWAVMTTVRQYSDGDTFRKEWAAGSWPGIIRLSLIMDRFHGPRSFDDPWLRWSSERAGAKDSLISVSQFPRGAAHPDGFFYESKGFIVGGFEIGKMTATHKNYGNGTSKWLGVHVLRQPHWVVVLTTGILPARWLQLHRRQRQAEWRRQNNLCAKCGYDLRASKDNCPECGMAIPTGFPAEGMNT